MGVGGHFLAHRSTLLQRRAIPHTITSSPALYGSPALEENAGPMDCETLLPLVPAGRPWGTRTIEAHVQHHSNSMDIPPLVRCGAGGRRRWGSRDPVTARARVVGKRARHR